MMTKIITLISAYGYFILFPLMIIEGPIVTIIASFLSSLGALNIFIVYVLALLGNLIGDVIYYGIGRFGREKFLGRYGKYIGLDAEKMIYIENHYKKHLLKTILIAKLTEAPVIPTLISAGIAKTDFKKFLSISILAEVPKVLIIVVVGYFFGRFYDTIGSYFKDFVGVMFIIFIAIIVFLLRRRSKKKNI